MQRADRSARDREELRHLARHVPAAELAHVDHHRRPGNPQLSANPLALWRGCRESRKIRTARDHTDVAGSLPPEELPPGPLRQHDQAPPLTDPPALDPPWPGERGCGSPPPP